MDTQLKEQLVHHDIILIYIRHAGVGVLPHHEGPEPGYIDVPVRLSPIPFPDLHCSLALTSLSHPMVSAVLDSTTVAVVEYDVRWCGRLRGRRCGR